MRLLNTKTLQLENVGDDPRRCEYAILSHTWGDDEVLFEDIQSSSQMAKLQQRNGLGFQKITRACEKASSRGFNYIWIDTCCIDKSSSAELSESINSMFRWYQNAAACYAYLEDVNASPLGMIAAFKKSRWFTRGWTLQELLAPDEVKFFDRSWSPIGERHTLAPLISQITGIDQAFMSIPDSGSRRDVKRLLQAEQVATRMGWMAHRRTTKEEDVAYCLMGIFDVNMPLLYGEGDKAFRRLQEEILRQSNDQSILIWRQSDKAEMELSNRQPFLASAPRDFNLRTYPGQEDPSQLKMKLTAEGLQLRIFKCPCRVLKKASLPKGSDGERWLGVLDCGMSPNTMARPALLLRKCRANEEVYRRAATRVIMVVERERKKAGFLDVFGDASGK